MGMSVLFHIGLELDCISASFIGHGLVVVQSNVLGVVVWTLSTRITNMSNIEHVTLQNVSVKVLVGPQMGWNLVLHGAHWTQVKRTPLALDWVEPALQHQPQVGTLLNVASKDVDDRARTTDLQINCKRQCVGLLLCAGIV